MICPTFVLFSQIPYNGRVREKVPQEKTEQWGEVSTNYDGKEEWKSFRTNPYNTTGWESFYSNSGVMKFGKTDLIIQDSLDTCSSTLESSYGCAFRPPLRSNILAGAPTFRIDQMEVFLVQDGGGHYQQGGEFFG